MIRAASLMLVSLLALVVLGAGQVIAHEGGQGTAIAVEPDTVAAGDTCVLAGTGLEPNEDRQIVLAGEGMTIDLGTVPIDGEGMFQIELTIPSHVPPGTYELRAIGDETLTTTISVTAAEGAPMASPAGDATGQEIVPRQRSPLELGLLGFLIAAAAGLGGFLVWRAERFRGQRVAEPRAGTGRGASGPDAGRQPD